MLDTVRLDVSHALRGLLRTRGFTVAAIVTLAVGIGATTAIFSVVYGVLIRPLPFPASDHLVMLKQQIPGIDTDAMSPADFLDWQAQSRAFDEMAAFTNRPLTLTGHGDPELLIAGAVTARFFDVLQRRAALGRTFVAAEGEAGRDDVVVLSDRLWRRRFAADPGIVGQRIVLDSRPVTVIGVMPPGFSFPEEVLGSGPFRAVQTVNAWVPFIPLPTEHNLLLWVVARIKPDYGIAQAQADANAVARVRAARNPRSRSVTMVLVTLHEYIVGDVRRLLLLLLAAVGVVLLIACANVANLLVARAADRHTELAIRSAIGASGWRLVRQFLIESTLLGVIGGASGVLLAAIASRGILAMTPVGLLPRVGDVAIDMPVLVFTLLVSLGTGLIFGLAPLLHALREGTTVAIRGASPTHTPRLRTLRTLVAVEVAFAMTLLGPANLLARSFMRLIAVDPGFSGANVVSASVTLPNATYRTVPQMARFHGEVLERLSKAPGVKSAAAVNWPPFGGALLSGDVLAEGSTSAPHVNVAKVAISADYFNVMGIDLVRGRVFTDADAAGAERVVVLTESAAMKFWPGDDALGRRITLGFGRPQDQQWASVVGIVRDVKQTALSDATMPAIYAPVSQVPVPFLVNQMTYVLRVEPAASNIARDVRAAIHAVDPNLPISRMAPLDALISFSVAQPRFRTLLFGAFAATALLLVATGVFGVLTHSVTRRTREIGLRMAVGAVPTRVARLIIGEMLGPVIAGTVAGLGGALAGARLIRNLLFGVDATDPATFAMAAVFVLLLSVAASYLPARRAANVDPAIALRHY